MAQLEVPPAPAEREREPAPPQRFAGDDAVPRGLAVTSAILLALTAGGVVAGVAGAILAIPVAAVTSASLEYMRKERSQEQSAALVAP
jgi:hypothetical protein